MNFGIDKGRKLAKLFWPGLILTDEGGAEDRSGVDAYLDGLTVQIKYDSAIPRTGNIYHEIYEKTVNREDQAWRHSHGDVDVYIFITESEMKIYGYLAYLNHIALSEEGRILYKISPNKTVPTSMGFLIPKDRIIWNEIKEMEKREGFSNA